MARQRPERPIFIVGPGRSGTTLVRSLLSAHSRIAVTPETHFLKRAYMWGFPKEEPANFSDFWEAYTRNTRFTDLGLDAEACLQQIRDSGDYSFRSVFDTILSGSAAVAGKPRIGEKTPGHSAFLDAIFSWYPDAQVILLQRDPRSVVASQLKTPWVRNRLSSIASGPSILAGTRAEMVAYYARDWRRVYEHQTAEWRADPRLMLLQYESLTSDPQAELERLCRFLGERFESQMIAEKSEEEAPEPKTEVGGEWEAWRRKHHEKSRAPITTESLKKWRSALSSREVAMIEGHCGSVLRRGGYEFTMSASSRAAGAMAVRGLSGLVAAEKNVVWKVASWRRPPDFSVGLGVEPIDVAYRRTRDARA